MAERQPTRASFAFQPAQAVQGQRNAQPQVGRMGNVGGGQSRSGVVSVDPASLSVNAGATLPGFLEKLVEPVIEARQQERVMKGFAAARAGQTMNEIAEEQPMLSGVFGQTDFERGASMFYARKAVNDIQTEVQTNLANYAAMTPADATQALWDAAEATKTGDRETDNAISALMIDAVDKLQPSITRAQVEYRTQTLIRGKLDGVVSSGAALRAATVNANMNPETADPRQLAEQRADFLSGFGIVPGMTLEAQGTIVTQAARAFLADGNLAAYRAMRDGGSQSLLFQTVGADEATYSALESAYYTASRRANNVTIASSQTLQDRIGLFNSDAEFRVFKGSKELREEMEAINAAVQRENPGAEPFFDEEAIIAREKSYSGEQATEVRTQEEREFRLQLEQFKIDNDPNRPEAVEARAAQKVENIKSSILQGDTSFTSYSKDEYDDVAMSMFRNDPMGAVTYLQRLYQNQGQNGFLPKTAEDMTARARQNVSGGVASQGFITTYNAWKRFAVDANGRPNPNGMPAQAAYFGEMHQQFLSFQNQVGNGVPEAVAFERVFNDPANLPGAERQSLPAIPEKERDDWRRAITHGSRWFGPSGMTPASTDTMLDWVAPLAQDLRTRNPSLSRAEAKDQAISQLMSRNVIDVAGRWAWTTPTKSPGLGDLLPNIPPDRLGSALEYMIDMNRANQLALRGVDRNSIEIRHTGGTTYADSEWYFMAYPTSGPNAGRPVGMRFTAADVASADRSVRSRSRWGSGASAVITQ